VRAGEGASSLRSPRGACRRYWRRNSS